MIELQDERTEEKIIKFIERNDPEYLMFDIPSEPPGLGESLVIKVHELQTIVKQSWVSNKLLAITLIVCMLVLVVTIGMLLVQICMEIWGCFCASPGSNTEASHRSSKTQNDSQSKVFRGKNYQELQQIHQNPTQASDQFYDDFDDIKIDIDVDNLEAYDKNDEL